VGRANTAGAWFGCVLYTAPSCPGLTRSISHNQGDSLLFLKQVCLHSAVSCGVVVVGQTVSRCVVVVGNQFVVGQPSSRCCGCCGRQPVRGWATEFAVLWWLWSGNRVLAGSTARTMLPGRPCWNAEGRLNSLWDRRTVHSLNTGRSVVDARVADGFVAAWHWRPSRLFPAARGPVAFDLV
jgi:hypothetical protein